MRRFVHRPSPAMVVAFLALLVASAGSAVAATVITSAQIKNGTIQVRDLSKAARKALRSASPAGPTGATGAAGPAGPVGLTGATGTTGPAGRSALEALHSGEKVRGVWALSDTPATTSTDFAAITFPVPAPSPVDSNHVVVAGNDPTSGDGCTGTATAPVSAPGFVCVYFAASTGTTSASGYSGATTFAGGANGVGDGSTLGFLLAVSGTTSWEAHGSWVYTAP